VPSTTTAHSLLCGFEANRGDRKISIIQAAREGVTNTTAWTTSHGICAKYSSGVKARLGFASAFRCVTQKLQTVSIAWNQIGARPP